jgi:hypothetical protein
MKALTNKEIERYSTQKSFTFGKRILSMNQDELMVVSTIGAYRSRRTAQAIRYLGGKESKETNTFLKLAMKFLTGNIIILSEKLTHLDLEVKNGEVH